LNPKKQRWNPDQIKTIFQTLFSGCFRRKERSFSKTQSQICANLNIPYKFFLN
jgi:hypothetical protein